MHADAGESNLGGSNLCTLVSPEDDLIDAMMDAVIKAVIDAV